MLTGDASVNPDAPIICCTAEVLANIALRDGARRRRRPGRHGRVPLLRRARPRLGLAGAAARAAPGAVPADVGDARRRRPVRGGPDPAHRPRRPRWSARPSGRCRCTTPTSSRRCTRRSRSCSAGGQAPVYVVHFTQAAALERAQALMSINVCTRAEKDAIAEVIGDFRFTAGFGRTLSRLVRHGIGVHHAGMLPQVPPAGRDARPGRAAQGHLRHRHPRRRASTCRSAPCCSPRCQQVRRRPDPPPQGARVPPDRRAGRPGRLRHRRRGRRAGARARDRERAGPGQGRRRPGKKRRKVVRKKPPEGFVSWGEPTFDRLVARRARAADLAVHGHPRHAAQRHRPARRRVRRDAAPADRQPRGPRRRSAGTSAGPSRSTGRCWPAASSSGSPSPTTDGRHVRLTVDLPARLRAQPAAVAVRARRPRRARPASRRRTPLDVVSVIESTLDDPRQVLSAQQTRRAARPSPR